MKTFITLLSSLFLIEVFAAPKFSEIHEFINQDFLFQSGEWELHNGSARLHGPEFDFSFYQKNSSLKHLIRGQKTLEKNHLFLQSFKNPIANRFQLLEYLYTIRSLSKYGKLSQKKYVYRRNLHKKIEKLRRMMLINNNFWPYPVGTEIKSIAEINALISITFLEFYQSTKNEKFLISAQQIMKESEKRLFKKKLSLFNNKENDLSLSLSPSVEFLRVYLSLFKVTKNKTYLKKAKELYKGIQRFRDPKMNLYSSQENKIGSSLKVKNFVLTSTLHSLIESTINLYKINQGPLYLQDVSSLFQFIENKMTTAKGQVLHHWINGRPANTNDPILFSSSDNLRTLYLILFLEKEFKNIL